ncbi:syntaxin-related protein KNOLLE [Tanacetum coccineum]
MPVVDSVVLTQFLKMETLLDDYVSQNVKLELEMCGLPLIVKLTVQYLHSITPNYFLEINGVVIHPLSYQQARNFRFECGLVYVSEPGRGCAHSLVTTPQVSLLTYEKLSIFLHKNRRRAGSMCMITNLNKMRMMKIKYLAYVELPIVKLSITNKYVIDPSLASFFERYIIGKDSVEGYTSLLQLHMNTKIKGRSHIDSVIADIRHQGASVSEGEVTGEQRRYTQQCNPEDVRVLVDGPNTTSFTANTGKKGLISRGKQPIGKVLTQAVRFGGRYRCASGKEHGRGKVLETVVEIQDHYDAAKEIETSLLELHQVFLDMDVMVEAQGEKMDDIEHHVINAAHYVNDETKNLKTEKVLANRERNWREDDSWSDIILGDIYNTFYKDKDVAKEADVAKELQLADAVGCNA